MKRFSTIGWDISWCFSYLFRTFHVVFVLFWNVSGVFCNFLKVVSLFFLTQGCQVCFSQNNYLNWWHALLHSRKEVEHSNCIELHWSMELLWIFAYVYHDKVGHKIMVILWKQILDCYICTGKEAGVDAERGRQGHNVLCKLLGDTYTSCGHHLFVDILCTLCTRIFYPALFDDLK